MRSEMNKIKHTFSFLVNIMLDSTWIQNKEFSTTCSQPCLVFQSNSEVSLIQCHVKSNFSNQLATVK